MYRITIFENLEIYYAKNMYDLREFVDFQKAILYIKNLVFYIIFRIL